MLDLRAGVTNGVWVVHHTAGKHKRQEQASPLLGRGGLQAFALICTLTMNLQASFAVQ
jgi:hypothetical protein